MRISDWSSDVCSSDLFPAPKELNMTRQPEIHKKPARRAEATHKTPKANPVAPQALPSKLNQLEAMLNRPVGASIADMVATTGRSEEHTSELQSLMRISSDVFCLKKKKTNYHET